MKDTRQDKINALAALLNGNTEPLYSLLPPVFLTYFIQDGMYHLEREHGQYDILTPDEFQALKARHKNRMIFETQKSYV